MKLFNKIIVLKAILSLIIITAIGSCKKLDSTRSEGQGLIQVAISGIAFDSEQTLGNRAATAVESTIQRNTIKLSDDFLMVAELHPEEPTATTKDPSKAALVSGDIAPNIRYRVLVYNQAGAFVTERDYIRGQEGNTPALELDGGSTYTFVVVSLGSTGVIPATTPAIATRTLANSQINTTTGVNAHMYYQHTMTVTGNSINRLDILLKHRKPLITVTINAAQTGYNITEANGRFNPHNNGTLVNLSDGSHTQSGTEVGVTVAFNTVGSQTIVNTSSNFINAPNNNSTSFTLNSITIGSITATNLVPFTALNVTAGVRYNLTLNIVPNDQYITHEGLPAARINGVIWARHNIGVDPTVDPDAAPMDVTRHGDFFQWGRLLRSGIATSNNPSPYFASNAPANNTWNSGTETAPIKTAADPCPIGYRIPTKREHEILRNAVTATNMGPFADGRTRFDSAKILTSRRNAAVRLTLPAQGWFSVSGSTPYNNLGSIYRGARGYYHASFSTNNPRTSKLRFDSSSITEYNGGNNVSFKVVSLPIRCVAE